MSRRLVSLYRGADEKRLAAEQAQQVYEAERQSVAALLQNPFEAAIAAEVRDRRKERREQSDLDAQRWMAGAAIVSVLIAAVSLFALGLAVWFARLAWLAAKESATADNEALELTKTQLRESREAAVAEREKTEADGRIQEGRFKEQLAAAQAAAKAARDTADNASFIGRNQSRAYVHVASARLDYTGKETILGGEYEPEVFITLSNVGATPTKYVGYHVVGGLETWKATYDGYREIAHADAYETTNLAPKDSAEIKVWVDNLKKHVEAAVASKSASMDAPRYFTIRGRIVYKDVFDRQHFTDFGFDLYSPTAGTSEPMNVMTDGFSRYESYPPRNK